MSKLQDTIRKILEDEVDGTGTQIKEPAGPVSNDPELDQLEYAENPEVDEPVADPACESEVSGANGEAEWDPDLQDSGSIDISDKVGPQPGDHSVTEVGQTPMPVMPVAEMGTYMREEIENLTIEDVKVDRAEFAKLFEGLSPEALTKVADLFESTCNQKITTIAAAAISTITETATKLFESKITEEVAHIQALAEETSKEWLAENQIAIESSVRADLAESFIGGLKTLFVEHFIEIPESKVDLLEAFQTRIEKLEESISGEMSKTLEAKKALNESLKQLELVKFTKGMTEMQASKVVSLAEGTEFSTAAEFVASLKKIAENVAGTSTKPAAPTAPELVLETAGKPIAEDGSKEIVAEEVDPFIASLHKAMKAADSK